jgi:hypothetical protein
MSIMYFFVFYFYNLALGPVELIWMSPPVANNCIKSYFEQFKSLRFARH